MPRRMTRWLMSFATLALLLLHNPLLYAQGENITLNTPVTVDLSTSGAVDLLYQAAGSDTITIAAHSVNGDVDTKLELYDANGVLLADNDDALVSLPGLIDTDSVINQYTLPGAGTFTIRVTSFDGLDRGQVEVTLTGTSAGGNPPEPAGSIPALPNDAKALFAGDSLKVYLDGQSSVDLVYAASGPQTINVYATSLDSNADPVDSILDLLDPDGKVLVENDDLSNDSTDPGIENFQLPSAGIYTIRVSTYQDSPAGGVEVSLTSSAAGTASGGNDCSSASLAIGDTVSNSVRGSSLTELTFCGTAGQVVDIVAIAKNPASTTQDLNMVLVNPDGVQIADDDDSATNFQFDPAIRGFTLPATGEYTVKIGSNDGLSGDFDLTIEEH